MLETSWRQFRRVEVDRALKNGPMLVVVTQHNARSWVGIPDEVTDKGMVLINGSNRITLWFNMPSTKFCTVSPPGNITFGVGDHRLPLEI